MDNGVKEMDLMDAVRFLGEPAVLEQLAEECAELGQAALKMARLQRGENPTPKSWLDCKENLEEELADVDLCMRMVYLSGNDTDVADLNTVSEIESVKQKRLLQRLKEVRTSRNKEDSSHA